MTIGNFRVGDVVAVKGTIVPKGYGLVANVTDETVSVLLGTKLVKYNEEDIDAGKVKAKYPPA